ncbi:MAG: efflux RND transporter permease subunit [Verrucomicrobiales bacterium]|nr:efflux RND transporter permease subunit [Verrucomicrobiales bacterium]
MRGRSFTDIFIRHPVLALVVNFIIILMGWRAATSLPVQQYPKLESSSVVITTLYYGASAETIRGFLTNPIEQAVAQIGGVDYVESISRAGSSVVTVRLKLNYNATAALAEVSARLQQVRSELPSEAEPPMVEIQRADRPHAAFYINFNSKERTIPQITDWLTRHIQPQLATVEGVQRVTVGGGQALAMRIWINQDRLAAVNLAPGDIYRALQRNNYLAAVGRTKGKEVEINLLADTDLHDRDEFARLIVAEREGSLVRLSDVARVELGAEDLQFVARHNTHDGVSLGVWPLPGANEIEVHGRLVAEMDRIQKTLPAGMNMILVYDGTEFMRDALKEISKTLVETMIIVGIAVFLFLGSLRTALIPLIAMPISLVGACVLMLACSFSLNLLTILAIVLSVGLVVDDAIVVVENIERHIRLGKTRIQAALEGTRELVGPIIALTITLATVYAPIAFQGGITGSLFLEFAITLAGTVIISGLVALTLSPMLSAHMIHAQGKEAWLTRQVNRLFNKVRNAYGRLLDGALQIRGVIVLLSLVIMAAAVPLYLGSSKELAPVEDESAIRLFFEAAPDSTPEASARQSLELIKALLALPEANRVWSQTTNWGGFGGYNTVPWDQRSRSTKEMYRDVYATTSGIPGLRVFPRLNPPLPTPGQHDVELVLQTNGSVEDLLPLVQQTIAAGFKSGKFLYVDSDLKIDRPEARVVVDRERIADLGLDLASVGRELGTLLGGGYVNRFNFFDRSYKVIPQIEDQARATPEALLDLRIKTPAGDLVPISSFVRIESKNSPRSLNTFQQRNAVRVFGGVAPGWTKEAALDVLENAARSAGGESIGTDYTGESRQIRSEGSALVVTFVFAILLVYLVLAAQFRSFRDPLIVLLGSVPLTLSGALAFTYLDLTSINIYSQVGLITLVGLIARNGILIVEFANKLRLRGHSRAKAIREASLTRLRPVLMASAATIFGHFPLVLVSGPGAEARNSIGIVLVSGMFIGTIFTLFVVPVFYTLIASEHRPESAEEPETTAESITLPAAQAPVA